VKRAENLAQVPAFTRSSQKENEDHQTKIQRVGATKKKGENKKESRDCGKAELVGLADFFSPMKNFSPPAHAERLAVD
jgi:hypothetical protein